ncbi:MAG: hypothetical protein U0234_04755 [Sandaracinus sp.]
MEGWRWIDEVPDAGPLAKAARTFAARELGGEGVPAGKDALVLLARAIDRHAGGPARPAEDAAFVEGAGAFLGLVLIARLGGGHACRDGVHRVRLGPAGFVDPFGAIEEALETEPARAALVDAVARAEAEAAGRGAIARVALAFERVLAEVRPELRITDRFERRLWIDETEIDLGRAISAAEGESEATLQAVVKKLVDMLPGGAGVDVPFAEARARVLPRLVGPRFEPEVAAQRVAGELRVAWVLAYEGRARFVTPRDLARWGCSIETLASCALSNLAERSAKARFARIETPEGPIVMARTGDGHDSARLLLPGLPGTLAPELELPCLVAVPHRDALFACADRPPLARALAARVAEDCARAPHGISAQIYRLGADGSIAPA